jgi:hypothetical protein
MRTPLNGQLKLLMLDCFLIGANVVLWPLVLIFTHWALLPSIPAVAFLVFMAVEHYRRLSKFTKSWDSIHADVEQIFGSSLRDSA